MGLAIAITPESEENHNNFLTLLITQRFRGINACRRNRGINGGDQRDPDGDQRDDNAIHEARREGNVVD